MLRGHLEKSFNNLLDIKAVIGIETKDREKEDYVGTIWEGIRMANNGVNKGVYLKIQAKKVLEQLKARTRLETNNIKAELSVASEGAERAEHDRYKVANLQRQLDEMREDMIKIDRLEMQARFMEGTITTVFSILDDLMRKL